MPARPNINSNANQVRVLMQELGRPLTAYQILEALQSTTIRAPVQVYRALSQLIASGKVHRVESLNAFVLCRGHHVTATPGFLICKQCGAVQEFDDEAMAEISGRVSDAGFSVESLT